jgi:hypothetical protein
VSQLKLQLNKALQITKDPRLQQVLLFTFNLKLIFLGFANALFDFTWAQPILSHTIADMWYWVGFWQKTQKGLIPYVDFDYVYPPGSGLLYWFLGNFIDLTEGRWKSILFTHGAFMSLLDVINAGLIYLILKEINPKRARILAILFAASLTSLLLAPVRYESAVVTFALIGYWLHLKDKPFWATFFWSLGCWLKWYTFFFIIAAEVKAFWIDKKRNQWIQTIITFTAIAVLLNLPFMLACWNKNGNFTNWLTTYTFHAQRPFSWDTLLGLGVLWFGDPPLESFANNSTVILMTLAIVLRPELKLEYKGVLICIASIFFNRIYSPQFHLWFYPFLMFVIAQEPNKRWRWFMWLYLAIDVINVIVFPISFAYAIEEMKGLGALFAREKGKIWTIVYTLSILGRTVLLAGISGLILRTRYRPEEQSTQLALDLQS